MELWRKYRQDSLEKKRSAQGGFVILVPKLPNISKCLCVNV